MLWSNSGNIVNWFCAHISSCKTNKALLHTLKTKKCIIFSLLLYGEYCIFLSGLNIKLCSTKTWLFTSPCGVCRSVVDHAIVLISHPVLWYLCYLQWTTTGPESAIEDWVSSIFWSKSRTQPGSPGSPWSGQAWKWYCRISLGAAFSCNNSTVSMVTSTVAMVILMYSMVTMTIW